MNKKPDTGWGKVAGWYDELLEKQGDTFQEEVILPNLMRLLDPQKGEVILDLACGQGYFSREIARKGATVHASDISKQLIALAIKATSQTIYYHTAPSHDISFLQTGSVDKIIIVLAIQNIEDLAGTLAECTRVLKVGGRMLVVLNHPTFRIPKKTAWGWDEENKIQYRRVDQYLSEMRTKIDMHPGQTGGPQTVSFHRPLQVYFKALNKAHFAVARLEEWVSHKESKPGPRAMPENLARKEIPMFMCLDARKLK